jgi:ABC-type uncharacterized transport system permease subunit
MILSSASPLLAPGGGLLLVVVAAVLYALAAVPLAMPVAALRRFSAAALLGGFVLHALLLLIDIGGFGQAETGARLGFGPVLSITVWLVIAVYAVESRLVPLPAVRQWLGLAGVGAVLVAALFPGEPRVLQSALAPLHFALGVGSYGLFGAAVLHAVLLDAAERRMRPAAAGGPRMPSGQAGASGMPLLQLERITFRFVEAGFSVLTATLVLGFVSMEQWRWGDHKAVFSLLAWGVFAALLVGRRLRGWRGRKATRWLYVGALLLLLAYVGSRFVLEVMLGRAA